jgi:hypothetical protein
MSKRGLTTTTSTTTTKKIKTDKPKPTETKKSQDKYIRYVTPTKVNTRKGAELIAFTEDQYDALRERKTVTGNVCLIDVEKITG